ncbi:hypothetical protein [Bacillus cereus]|uniref:hypothetical protein n=1 Tax=Bacillus cereus TaxID=1396 RepID=UPI000BF655DB|nr:hypothetical protein [Bacillus cereus]PFI75762.1 hypothetical protein COI83_29795 [Bacillus cereus]
MTDYIFVNIAFISILPMILIYKICIEKFNDAIIEDASPKSRSILMKYGFPTGFIGLIGILFMILATQYKAGQSSVNILAILNTIIGWYISIVYVIRKTKGLTQNKGSRTVRMLNVLMLLVTSVFFIMSLIYIAM